MGSAAGRSLKFKSGRFCGPIKPPTMEHFTKPSQVTAANSVSAVSRSEESSEMPENRMAAAEEYEKSPRKLAQVACVPYRATLSSNLNVGHEEGVC